MKGTCQLLDFLTIIFHRVVFQIQQLIKLNSFYTGNSTTLTYLSALRESSFKGITLKIINIHDMTLYIKFTLYSQRFCGGLTPKAFTHSNSAIIALLWLLFSTL